MPNLGNYVQSITPPILASRRKERHPLPEGCPARMRIEIGPAVCLSQLDTVVIASDGLFDNLSIQEVVGSMRKGKLTPFG